ncbi:MAG TPA: hypothetical protein VNP04_01300, partial [Alphaproteobacteria bacterium]|nr:hypothetical protein [Alphaproteobacteria bacterium]
TVPNRVSNLYNHHDTYKLYNENEIIGSTSPEIVTIPKPRKKKKWYQKLVQIVITIIVVAVAIYAAVVLGPQVFGLVQGAIGGIVGVVAGTVAAAAAGYALGAVAGVVTQGLAVLAGLQDKFDWKAVRQMAKGTAIGAAAGGLANWAATQISNPALQALAKGAIEYGTQKLQNGEITNRSGLLLSMIPGGKALKAMESWKNTHSLLKLIDDNKKAIGVGLSLLEKSRQGGANTLDWVNAATQLIGAKLGEGSAYNRLRSGGVEFNWARIGQETLLAGIGALVVGAKYGEEAGLGFFGNQLGQSLGQGIAERAKLNDDLKFITPAERAQLLDNPTLTDTERLQAINQLAQRNRENPTLFAARREEEER